MEVSEEYINNEEFMEQLRISRRTAQSYRDKGLIPFVMIGNRIWYSKKDVTNMFLNNRHDNKK